MGFLQAVQRQSLQKLAAAAEEEMTEFLRPLLERLAGILHSRPSVDLQAGALAAISSAAAAAGKGFTPYARDALLLLRGFMEVSEVGQPYTMPVLGPYGYTIGNEPWRHQFASLYLPIHDPVRSHQAWTVSPNRSLNVMGLSLMLQPDVLRCRVRATEAVGIIVGAVGVEVLGPSLQEFIAAALQVG